MKTLNSWFEDPDGDPITFDAVNEDGKLKVSVNKTSIGVSLAPDSCGESEITFIAKDSLGAETKLTIPVYIKPVNDVPAPVSSNNIRYRVTTSGWEMKIDLDTLIIDVDDSKLKYSIAKSSSPLSQSLDVKLDGSVLKVKPNTRLISHQDYVVTVDVKDSEAKVSMKFTFTTDKESDGLNRVAVRKMNWQGAITAGYGSAAIFDMQGHVMWKAKLPVSEADVRNAAAQVQGRKVLMVNKQTWTIK